MKKSILSLAVAAGVSATAMANQTPMHINHQGLGEALVFPLYTAQNGNDTYIAIANTTSNAKAVKIRILEAENSVEVLDFNLYMSPEDHFSFAITANEDGGASLVTADNSCTVPQITGAIPFRGLKYAGDKGKDDVKTTDKDESFDNTSISRTQIGHIEVIEMGQIAYDPGYKPTGKPGDLDDGRNAVYLATLHDEDGVPGNCGAHTALWSTPGNNEPAGSIVGGWLADPTFGFQTDWNGGGLYGYGQVINVAEGTAFGYDAVAIADMVADGESGSAMHYAPGDIDPNFNDPAITNEVQTEGYSGAVDLTATAGGPVLAVAALFQATEIENDYVIDPDINALTDWVITSPTKFYHTNGGLVKPFNDAWDGMTACEPVVLETWDREEAFVPPPVIPGSGPDFSPSPTPDAPKPENNDLPLCFETNIVQFGDMSALKAKDVVVGVGSRLDYTEGWARLDMDEANLDTDTSKWTNNRAIEAMQGLPVTGFAVVKYTNGTLQGADGGAVLANYMISTEHKTTIVMSGMNP
jgi:hypothetical protein